MKITEAKVIVTSPSRNFATLKLTTDEGVTGIGDATLNGRELAVATYLSDHVAPLLIDRDPANIEDTWQFLYRSGYWRRGPVTMAAIAAVDMALWDIKGKVAGMPVYQLLGGASRRGLSTYGHASGRDTEEIFDSIRSEQEHGYTAIRVQSSVPGITALYGVAAQPQIETRGLDLSGHQRHLRDDPARAGHDDGVRAEIGAGPSGFVNAVLRRVSERTREEWIEAVTAVIVPKAGVTLTEEAVAAHLEPILAGYKRPKFVVFADALPKNPSGKLLKKNLRVDHAGIAGS